jgi:hypothetical protein
MEVKAMVDKHRYSYGGGIKAQEEQKWGRAKAEERYGPLKYRDGAPPPEDGSEPQRLGDRNNLRGPDWKDDHPNDWVRGFGKNGVESAEGRPNFDKGKR